MRGALRGGPTSILSAQVKATMTEEQKTQHDSDYKALLALYIALLSAFDKGEKEEALYNLSELRTDQAFSHVLSGLGIDYDYAVMLLRNMDDNNISQHDKDLRDRLRAAILNLIDFCVCEEYQLYSESSDLIGDSEVDFESEEYDELIALCSKYNDSYAAIENGDIEYAAMIAAKWISFSSLDYLVYWTQNDVKVRPWHMALQGYAASRDEFPSWMIPPIEYNCRCFLEAIDVRASVSKSAASIKGTVKNIEKPKELDGVYSESLAKCGRIFSKEHPYFKVKRSDKDMLQGFVSRLKEKYNV